MALKKTPKNTPCPACGGTGQLNSFRGESRFLLTAEECPHCDGFGYIIPLNQEKEAKKQDPKNP